MSARKNLELTLAINDYDHVRDLVSGAVPVEGVDLTCLQYPIEEIFFRFTLLREWHISELSMAKYCSLRAHGDDSIVAIPVFPSRCFRHSALFVRPMGPSMIRPRWRVLASVCRSGPRRLPSMPGRRWPSSTGSR